MTPVIYRFVVAWLTIFLAGTSGGRAQETSERARDIGIPLEGTPGPLNAITDVPGVAVGQTTLDPRIGAPHRGTGAGPHRRDRDIPPRHR